MYRFIALLVTSGAFIVTACASPADPKTVTLPTWVPISPLPSGVSRSAQQAVGHGRLTLGEIDGYNCLWLEGNDGTRMAVIWPASYHASSSDSGTGVIFDGDRPLASIGDWMEISGGYAAYDGPCSIDGRAFHANEFISSTPVTSPTSS
jgi:hypothetical protein